MNNPHVFAFSPAVFLNASTFYGSVDQTGIEFFSVFIRTTLVMLYGFRVLRKIIHIFHDKSITSIADFISARYGKYRSTCVWAYLISLLVVMPYIGL